MRSPQLAHKISSSSPQVPTLSILLLSKEVAEEQDTDITTIQEKLMQSDVQMLCL